LIYHNQNAWQAWAGMSSAERMEGVRAHSSLVQDLTESGELVAAEALAEASEGKRVLVSAGRTTTTDGPFPELKEHLAGFYLIECEDIERAVAYAARIPEAAAGGLVEVRPVLMAGGSEL
jgi:hypothetical protein